jgi:hypothetical protein
MSRLRRLASSLRTGFLRASTPPIPDEGGPGIALTWVNEVMLVGISVPSPRSFR